MAAMLPIPATADQSPLVRQAQIKAAYDAQTAKLEASNSNAKKLDGAAKNFEAVFANEMLKPMFEGTSSGGAFGGGQGEKIFNGMMVTQYGKMMADNDSLGIAKQIKSELLRLQEAKQ